MKRFFLLITLLSIIFGASNVMSAYKQEHMIKALESGEMHFFKKIAYHDFERLNSSAGGKITLIKELAYNKKNLPNIIKALLGAFGNVYTKVRTAVYYELADFEQYRNKLEKTEEGREVLKTLTAKATFRRESDINAKAALNRLLSVFGTGIPDALKNRNSCILATMHPKIFIRTNQLNKTTYIGEILNRGDRNAEGIFLTLVQAVTYPPGNAETQVLIVRELGQSCFNFNKRFKRRMAVRIKILAKRMKESELKSALNNLVIKLIQPTGT